ncbi:ABC transporter substrate-binding protein [Bradyrhizobium viridifuturi]|nr:ABC transporter substrate-binding protein [uncultured Bradyrhizobium sp.]ERF83545.1 MAG: NitT/TauT family transport system substrate-binding protein [Bradyrhizobium sp. DFCI-1]MBR1021550.1 ABC transporter substrate-binding protein [Bradyrhizobium viridifuturi]MCA3791314.1 ABC transporter substrate-binding protein [Burkholderia sp.]OYU62738.1 MAG: ABC transporter substrate-binding protein [Bradyrhizobium sp. PARBB1]PSO26877.1 ABC transporter substrate-binding protein [Bradyrhizobium sp. MOS0
MTIDQHQPFSPSRRALLGLAGLAGIAAPFGVMGAARAFPALGLGPAADPLSAAPICRVANSDEAPKGPARHIRFAYNGTGICTAAVPVALHRGHFARHNLDVEFLQLAGSTDQMLQSLATDKADAGSSMLLNWLKPLEQGIDVKLTTGLHGGCTRLFVRKESGFKDITDLKGKTIGVSSISGPPRNFFAILLSDNGLDPQSDVQWREFPADLQLTALQRGEIQAIADSDPNAWLTERRANGDLVEIASNLSGDYANLSCCTLGVRSSLWASDPAAVKALTLAVREAAHHVAEHPDDAAEIFSKYTPKVAVADLATMLRSHTHGHHPAGADLRREVVKITSDLKRATIIKPNTDPAKLANRVVVDIDV